MLVGSIVVITNIPVLGFISSLQRLVAFFLVGEGDLLLFTLAGDIGSFYAFLNKVVYLALSL